MEQKYNLYIYDEDGNEIMQYLGLDTVSMLVHVSNNTYIGAQCLVEKA